MYNFLKIRQRSTPLSSLAAEQEADNLWQQAPFASSQATTIAPEKFWESYESLLAQAKKNHKNPVIQQAVAPTSPSIVLPKKEVFRSRKPSLNFVGLLTDLVVAIIVAPSSEATFMFCLVVVILHLILILFSLPPTKYVILEQDAMTIKNQWNSQKQRFLLADVQSVSFYSREEDADKLYIETFDMEFCVDVHIKSRKIERLFYLLHQKGITINTTL